MKNLSCNGEHYKNIKIFLKILVGLKFFRSYYFIKLVFSITTKKLNITTGRWLTSNPSTIKGPIYIKEFIYNKENVKPEEKLQEELD